jgi:hypothetical protein
MPVIYETTAEIDAHGKFRINLEDFPFEKGTRFSVRLIPQFGFDSETFKKNMQDFIDECAENNPYKNMTKDEILAELRCQREKMYE